MDRSQTERKQWPGDFSNWKFSLAIKGGGDFSQLCITIGTAEYFGPFYYVIVITVILLHCVRYVHIYIAVDKP